MARKRNKLVVWRHRSLSPSRRIAKQQAKKQTLKRNKKGCKSIPGKNHMRNMGKKRCKLSIQEGSRNVGYRLMRPTRRLTRTVKSGSRYSRFEDKALLLFVVQELRQCNPLAWRPRGKDLWKFGLTNGLLNLRRSVASMKDRFCRIYKSLNKTTLLNLADREFLLQEIQVSSSMEEDEGGPSEQTLLNGFAKTASLPGYACTCPPGRIVHHRACPAESRPRLGKRAGLMEPIPRGRSEAGQFQGRTLRRQGMTATLVNPAKRTASLLCCSECLREGTTKWYKCNLCPCYYRCASCEHRGLHDQHVMQRITSISSPIHLFP